MLIGILKEHKEFEKRVALSPTVAASLIKEGFEITIESGAGDSSYFVNDDYSNAGVKISTDKNAIYQSADIILKVNAPSTEEIQLMKKDAVLISFAWAQTNPDLVEAAAKQGISLCSMDAIPRISRAQKMDALSSQSNLAGYKTVIMGANALGKIFPMLMTAAGTIRPAKVVIMGAGVVGLQAIATANRLGAIVEVSDIRPETKEQIESLGGKFIELDEASDAKTEGGYVKDVSDEFLKKQQALIAKHVSAADLVITTALIFGKKAPLLVTEDMVKNMQNGSVLVDIAVEQGGNCEISEYGKTVVKHGVTIIGEPNLPSLLPLNASELYAKNISAFLLHLTNENAIQWDMNDEITAGALITHQGNIVHPSLKKDLQLN
ncbi:MAG: Re/Si-specific NAD(P)(+) transhydrogenase subunit alpha [Bacteroidia bacterium]|nr:Re/Si-specific NAD(P)(+) transhydrogenase subunit alpha [Bacteroidia bacterium]